LNFHQGFICPVSKSTQIAGLLERTALIIWDEVPMQNKYDFEIVNLLLKDFRGNDVLFGGVPVIFGRDFAQILPVVKRANRARTVAANIQQSHFWPRFTVLHLRRNMRLISGNDNFLFGKWIRNLFYDAIQYGHILFPSFVRTMDSPAAFFDQVYSVEWMRTAQADISFFRDRAILTTRNDTVAAINNDILKRLPGQSRVYDAVDSVNFNIMGEDMERSDIFQEFSRAQNPSGLAPSRLELKVGASIICFRNLFPREGLCNGTRMVITKFRDYCIKVRIIGGQFHNEDRVIPRITLTADMGEGTWKHSRKQFPVRLCFAMTINKVQRQLLKKVEIDLRQSVFTHGQFYVALSRVTDMSNLDILLPYRGSGKVENIVYPEVLLR
jgi:hypothetical protein